MADCIFAFAEARDGQLRKTAHEVVTAARLLADELASEVHAVLLGAPGIAERAAELGSYGADRVSVGTSDVFTHYSAEGFTAVVSDFLRDHECRVAIFPGSSLGKDLAPRVAARLEVGYANECTALEVEDGEVIATRPEYAGKALARIGFPDRPALLSIRPNVFTPVEDAREPQIETLNLAMDGADFGAVVREIREAAGAKLDVAEAPVIVSGGRGMREPENFKLLEELAEAFGGRAAVGASRAVVDAGWRPHAEQVGQTGKTVSPTLYFAIGISGAIQHLAGMRTSRYIVAINKDPEAPIFKVADYGIVGDLFEIVPRLTEEVRRLG